MHGVLTKTDTLCGVGRGVCKLCERDEGAAARGLRVAEGASGEECDRVSAQTAARRLGHAAPLACSQLHDGSEASLSALQRRIAIRGPVQATHSRTCRSPATPRRQASSRQIVLRLRACK